MIEHLRKLNQEDVEQFLLHRNHEALGIHPKLAEYILQLNEAANLLREYRFIAECAEQLKKSFPELSISTCKNRIYDSIKYFNNPSNVIASEWNMFFADQMLRLSRQNEESGDLKEARLALEKSREYYLESSAGAIHPDRIRFKPQIVSPDIVLERMFIKEKGVLAAFKEAVSLIEGMDMNDAEKKRIVNEAERELNVTDITHEEV